MSARQDRLDVDLDAVLDALELLRGQDLLELREDLPGLRGACLVGDDGGRSALEPASARISSGACAAGRHRRQQELVPDRLRKGIRAAVATAEAAQGIAIPAGG